MKRTLLIILALMGFFTLLPANPVLTEQEEEAINALLEYRLFVSTLPGDEAVAKLISYKTKNSEDSSTYGFSEEVSLVLDAFIELDILSYYQTLDSKDPKIQEIAESQYKTLQAWIDNHKNETPNKWTYCMAAEAFDWYLAYLPLTQILAKGLLPKKYYTYALDQDPEMSYALSGLAQWQYYAPVFAGGGNKASKTSFTKAIASAKTDPDEYVARLFYSQLLFETKNYDEAESQLQAAESIYPGSKRLARFRQMNNLGYSWFEFARDYEDNRAKLSKPLVY